MHKLLYCVNFDASDRLKLRKVYTAWWGTSWVICECSDGYFYAFMFPGICLAVHLFIRFPSFNICFAWCDVSTRILEGVEWNLPQILITRDAPIRHWPIIGRR